MSTSVHPTAFVGDGVELGDGTVVGPHAVVLGPARIGRRVWIGPGAVIGTPPEISSFEQNVAWDGVLLHEGVVIGDDAVIRELSTVHQGSHRPTTIGDRTWLLNSSYVAHDCLVGDDVVLSAGVRIGGHSVIGDHVNCGMNAVLHQRRSIGPGAMVGMGTPVSRDVPPFVKLYGSPPRVRGINAHALRRLGVDDLDESRRGRALAGEPDAFDGTAVARLVESWTERRNATGSHLMLAEIG